MEDVNTSSKRLAKNTILMYFRMIFLMLISLYTARVILQQLGVEDYGIYNVVGSIVALFTSLRSIFAASTQRFLNYEMGIGKNDKLQLIFNLSTILNGGIALIFLVFAEIVGLSFIFWGINVDPSRLFAVHCLFQLSVLTTIVSIMNVPLDACIIAHERMDFYAYLSIFDGIAKLAVCFLLSYTSHDKLIVYGILLFIIAILVREINYIFCRYNFQECHYKKIWDKSYFKKMTSYAGWALLGNTAYSISQSGINMILNVFGGPVVNAARGIAYQVSNSLWGFISNLVIVIKPHTVKTYASGQIDKAYEITYFSSKLYFIVQLFLLICISFVATEILQLWLGQVPEYVELFLDIVLLQYLIKSLQMPLDMLFSAEGDIKKYQIFEGVVLLLPVPVSYFLLTIGFPYYSAFISLVFFEIASIGGIVLIANKVCKIPVSVYIKRVIVPCSLMLTIASLGFLLNLNYADTFISKLFFIIMTLSTVSIVQFIFLTKNEKVILGSLFSKRVRTQY